MRIVPERGISKRRCIDERDFILGVRTIAEAKDSKGHRVKTICVVEFLSPKVPPEFDCVFGHVSLAGGGYDKNGQRKPQEIRLSVSG